MPSAQDPFYVVKEEIQESVSIFFFPISPRFCYKFNFQNEFTFYFVIKHAFYFKFLLDFSVTSTTGSGILRS